MDAADVGMKRFCVALRGETDMHKKYEDAVFQRDLWVMHVHYLSGEQNKERKGMVNVALSDAFPKASLKRKRVLDAPDKDLENIRDPDEDTKNFDEDIINNLKKDINGPEEDKT